MNEEDIGQAVAVDLSDRIVESVAHLCKECESHIALAALTMACLKLFVMVDIKSFQRISKNFASALIEGSNNLANQLKNEQV